MSSGDVSYLSHYGRQILIDLTSHCEIDNRFLVIVNDKSCQCTDLLLAKMSMWCEKAVGFYMKLEQLSHSGTSSPWFSLVAL